MTSPVYLCQASANELLSSLPPDPIRPCHTPTDGFPKSQPQVYGTGGWVLAYNGDEMMTVEEIQTLLKDADERQLAALERSLVADTRKGVISALKIARRRVDKQKEEQERLSGLYEYERSLLEGDGGVIVGLDEVGRGPVAGPLAVGAVVLPLAPRIEGLNDSKQLSPKRREEIASEIQRTAIAWTVEYVEPAQIDELGMSDSLKRAFKGALGKIESTGLRADIVLIDGNPLHIDSRERNVVKGDSLCASIAAASIVAKVARDKLMEQISDQYPEYEFAINKGYGTQQHIEAIKTHGLCPLHRKSFCGSFMQQSLF